VFAARQSNAGGPVQRSSSEATCGENHPRYRRHPLSVDCQLYVACVTGPDGRYVPVVMRCLLGLQWDDDLKMCVTQSRTCHQDHVTRDHVTAEPAQFDASWLQGDEVFHRRQPVTPDDEHQRHQLRHFRRNDVIY